MIQRGCVHRLGKYVPLAAISRAVEPRVGGDLHFSCVNQQAGVAYIFYFHDLLASEICPSLLEQNLNPVRSPLANAFWASFTSQAIFVSAFCDKFMYGGPPLRNDRSARAKPTRCARPRVRPTTPARAPELNARRR